MTEATEASRSRRERPAKPALSRAGVVSTAVRIMRTEGIERVTMRRLAQELDTGAASLYVYVSNAAELHAAVLDELLADVDLSPVTGEGDWIGRLHAVLVSYVVVLMEYPSQALAAMRTRPSGPHYLDLAEAVLALLHEGEMDGPRAAWAVDLLLQIATATAAEQSGHNENPGNGEEWAALTRAVESADPDRYPRIRALGPELLSGEGEDRLRWALTALTNGILATPRSTPANRKS